MTGPHPAPVSVIVIRTSSTGVTVFANTSAEPGPVIVKADAVTIVEVPGICETVKVGVVPSMGVHVTTHFHSYVPPLAKLLIVKSEIVIFGQGHPNEIIDATAADGGGRYGRYPLAEPAAS
jgi:hypothetical protein